MIIQGRDLTQMVNDFVWYMRNLLVVKTTDDAEDMLDMSSENIAILKEEAELTDSDTLMRFIRIFRSCRANCAMPARNAFWQRLHLSS